MSRSLLLRRSAASTLSSSHPHRAFSTTPSPSVDFAHIVIGAGVIGLSTAARLATAQPTLPTLLLDAHPHPGTETTSRNSGVIHAGLYYPRDSLKTRLCLRGRRLLYARCAAAAGGRVPHAKLGKWVVAQDGAELEALERVRAHAAALGVPVRMLGAAERARRQPAVRAEAGALESPETGIVDAHALVMDLMGEFEAAGGTVAMNSRVARVERDGAAGGYKVYTAAAAPRDGAEEGEGGGEEACVTADAVVNAAGLHAVAVSNTLLPPPRQRKAYFSKGTYYTYVPPASSSSSSSPLRLPTTLVYPAPRASAPGLGTHLTLDLAGRARFGPDAVPTADPADYAPSSDAGTLAAAAAEIERYLPGIRGGTLVPEYCGVRPKLSEGGAVGGDGGKAGGFVDFYIAEEEGFPGFVNCLGIESPGLTSSLAVGEMVERMLHGKRGREEVD